MNIELSSFCNARCPQCVRNVNGFPHNQGYKETNFPLEIFKKSFSSKFLSQIDAFLISGNFGDFLLNPQSVEILSYIRQHNSKEILISTNGSARDEKFWSDLGKLNVTVQFCLDGLEDTHHLYRLDTDWHKIINNAKIFMAAGGTAYWKMIRFKHNEHQIEDCKKLATEYGFSCFTLIDTGRNKGPVFDRKGKLTHILGDGVVPDNVDFFLNADPIPPVTVANKKISCWSKSMKSIYVSAECKVYPCCYMGHSPETFSDRFFNLRNKQLVKVVANNSLYDNDLETAIKWFSTVESSWSKDTYEEGRLIICNDFCAVVNEPVIGNRFSAVEDIEPLEKSNN